MAAARPPAGPIKIKWIKVVDDGGTKRCYYEGDSGGAAVFHYFDLTVASAPKLATLGDSMASGNATVMWNTDTGPSLNFISSEKSAAIGTAPKLPTVGIVYHQHDNVIVS